MSQTSHELAEDELQLCVVVTSSFPCCGAGVRALICDADKGINVLVEESLQRLPASVAELGPAAVLVDVDGDLDEIVSVLHELRDRSRELPIGLLVGTSSQESMARLIGFMPNALLSKVLDGVELARSVRLIALGHFIFGNEAIQHLREPQAPPTKEPTLDPIEQELLQHLVCGLDNNEIAERMFMSRSGVKRSLQVILAKLGVRNRVQAAVAAERRRLV